MAKTSNYWDKRAIKRMTEAEKSSEIYINRIKNIYEQAYKDVNKEIIRAYNNYSKETGIDVQKLKTLLTKKETDKVWKTLKRQGLDKYVMSNYKSRISRLEQIQAQIYAKAKQIYPKEELQQKMCYKGVINNSYYKAVYDTQMGTGYDFSFNKIDNNLFDRLLNEQWSGKNYSQRIWTNTDILADSLSQLLGGAMLSGQSIEKTTQQIKDRFKVSKYYAERLVRTETNHFNNEADAMAYEELGINEYVFVATLDSRTSDICQQHDGKRYKYKDKEVGVNFPPLHPNCRSKTRGYLGEEAEKNLKRRARNPITGKNEIIDNITYSEWAKSKGILPKADVKPKVNVKPIENKPKNTLTDNDKKALEYYVSGEGMYINNFLRSRADVTPNDMLDIDKKLVKDLDNATNKTLKSTTLYRSVDASVIFPNINEFEYDDLRGYINYGTKGAYETNKFKKIMDTQVKEFKDLGYVSTTKDYNIAKDWGDFTGSSKPIVLELNIDDSVKGIDLDFLDIADDPQKEVLLARNQMFKVKDITSKDGNIYVKLDVTNVDINLKPKLVDKPVVNTKVTLNDLPSQLTTPKEARNSQLFIDALNNPNADPTVVNVYKNMGKRTKYDFKVSHAKRSSINYKYNMTTGNVVDVKLTIPNIKDAKDVGNINTVLHENMHFIDFMSGKGIIYKSTETNLMNIVKSTDAKMSDKVKSLFNDFNKLCSEHIDNISNEFKPKYQELNNLLKDNKINYKEYKKNWSKINKLRNEALKEAEFIERNYLGGGVNSLEDIYDALSGGYYRDSDIVRYGHGTRYYRKYDSRVKEIVANYGALSITRPDLIELLKSDKPNLVKELEELMKAMS